MVKLYVDNPDQLTVLEYLLYSKGIDYEVVKNDGRYGLKPPYLLVYGVPLDEKRAISWATHRLEECYCE